MTTLRTTLKHVSRKLWPDPPKQKGILSTDLKPILSAAHQGDLKQLEIFLRRYEIKPLLSVTMSIDTEATLLHYAAKKGDLGVLTMLVDYGADIHTPDNQNRTPLHIAASEGQKEAAALLVARGAKIDKEDDAGWQPLAAAAAKGHRDTVETLVDLGAPLNALHRNPLHCAVRHPMTLKLLLDRGANADAVDVAGCTALMWTIERDPLPQILHSAALLLKHGARLDPADINGKTARHRAADLGAQDFLRLIDAEVAEREADRIRLQHPITVRRLHLKHKGPHA